MTTTLSTPLDPKRLNLLDGQQHPYTAGRVTVTVQCVRYDQAYTVVVEQGGTLRLDDLCGSYPTEQEACMIARGYCQMFLQEARA